MNIFRVSKFTNKMKTFSITIHHVYLVKLLNFQHFIHRLKHQIRFYCMNEFSVDSRNNFICCSMHTYDSFKKKTLSQNKHLLRTVNLMRQIPFSFCSCLLQIHEIEDVSLCVNNAVHSFLFLHDEG